MSEQANVEDLLDELYDVLDKGVGLPFSAGRVLVDGEEAKAILEEIKDALPEEIKNAKTIVAEKERIITNAQQEAAAVVRLAEDKVKKIINQEHIVQEAQIKANEYIAESKAQVSEMREAATEYIDNLMKKADESLSGSLDEIRATREGFISSQS